MATLATVSLAATNIIDRAGQSLGRGGQPTSTMSQRTTSATWVKGMLAMLSGEGVDTAALLAAAGVDAASLDAPGTRLSTETISRVWELAAERSGNPAIGLAQHDVARPASFDVVGYTMMSCASLAAAFERLTRYLRILSDVVAMELAEEGGRYCVTFDVDGGDRPVPRQRVEYILAMLISFCRWVAGREIAPLRVEIPYPVPGDRALYDATFRCPLGFGARSSRLEFALADVNRPLATSNPVLAELHERFAGEYLARAGAAETGQRVRAEIIARLPDGEPRRDEIAHALHLSERTLQRRLQAEGTSFHQLLDDTRRELADRHLGELQLSLAQAAYLLGFADQSSFVRACKRWFGVPPGQYRGRRHSKPAR